jgi:hypothetical protein
MRIFATLNKASPNTVIFLNLNSTRFRIMASPYEASRSH